MSELVVVTLAGYAMQICMVALMSWLLYGYHRETDLPYIRFWYLSWLALGAYLIGAAAALSSSQVLGPAHPLRMAVGVVSQLGGYFSLLWLLLGVRAYVGLSLPGRSASSRITLLVVLAALIASSLFAFDPDAGLQRLMIRVGGRSAAAVGVFLLAAWWLSRHRRDSRGPRLLATVLVLYAAQHVHYVAVGFVAPLLLDTFVGYTAWLGFVDTFLQLTLGLSMTLCLLEDQLTGRRRAEARRNKVVEASLDAVVTIDQRGRITDWNPRAESIFGWKADDVIGTELTDSIIPERHRDAHRNGLAHFLETGEGPALNRRLRMEARTASGSEIPIELTISPIHGPDGWVFSAFMRDLSRELELERKVRQSHKIEALGRLAGGIAHDFNNLLTVILGHAELLAQRATGNGDTGSAEPVREISVAAQRGRDLVSQLMTYSRQDPVDVRTVNLAGVIDQSTSMLSRLLPETVELDVAVEDDLPLVTADPGAVERIVMNLVTNGRDAMPGGGRIRVTATRARENGADRVLLEVRDTGLGMTDEQLGRALDPFYTTKPPGEGTGLGLAVVHGLAEELGATVDLTSEPGGGTRVTIGFLVPEAF